MGRLSLFFWSKFFAPAWKKVANQKKYLLVIYSMRMTDHHFYAEQQNQLHIGGDWLMIGYKNIYWLQVCLWITC